MSISEENLLESLEDLPEELKRSFAMIREKNTKCDSLMKAIDDKSGQYLELLASDPTKHRPMPDDIVSMYEKLKKYSENNVQLATKTYELVDKYIQNLDVDLTNFEAQMKGQTTANATGDKKQSSKKKSSQAGRKPKKNVKDDDQMYTKPIKSPVAVEMGIRQLIDPTQNVSSESLDMPVDPNEPTYCLCNQVSYGDMVGCDNADCPIEWFHFSCVGLTANPRGKWYCPRCKDKKK